MSGDFSKDAREARSIIHELADGIQADCKDTALATVGRNIGLSKWTTWGLAYGRRKSVPNTTMQALRRAYWDYLGRQINRFEAELRSAEMRSDNGSFADLASAAEAVVARLKAARERPD